ncbi:MAG: hypothetical protein JO025_00160 [Verrucomicrobia bacterium]|nr:hypothetical protein [Verrucomicrobiota bacterium]
MWANDSDESPGSFIGEHLTIFQARWLLTQSEALGQSRNDLFEAILREWFLSVPPVLWMGKEQGEIARRAVGDFILWHYPDFLPVAGSQ